MGTRISHTEIGGKNPTKLAAFYGEVFGFSTMPMPGMDYHMADFGPGNGPTLGIGESGDMPSYVTFYFDVEDAQAALDKAVAAGASVIAPVMEIPGMVKFALFADPEGHVLGVAQSVAPSA